MAFEKQEARSFDQLTINTQYRFIELEISRALKILTNFTLNENYTVDMLTNALVPPHLYSEELRKEFKEFLTNANDYPNVPLHAEKVQYFRYHNLGAHKVRKYISVPLKDLVRGGKFDSIPNFQPNFSQWDKIPYAIVAWNHMKTKLNLFDEELLQQPFVPIQAIPDTIQIVKQPAPLPEQPKPEQSEQKKDRYIKLFNITREQIEKGAFFLEWTEEELMDPMQQQIMNDNIAGGQPIAIVTHNE